MAIRSTVSVLLLIPAFLAGGLQAQPAFQVEDINTTARLGAWTGFESAALGSVGFFTTSDGVHGTELWRSDGTAAGTAMVRDLCPGVCSSDPSELTVVGGALFFRADDGVRGPALWKTDGTAAGTVLVRDIAPFELAEINGLLVFAAESEAAGRELWKSDGTEAGTVLLADLWPGAEGSSPLPLGRAGTLLFLDASAPGQTGLWKTDGTPGGTGFVEAVRPGIGDSLNQPAAALGNRLFFGAGDPEAGLWVSDGTPGGTYRVSTVQPGGYTVELVAFDGQVFFGADGADGLELWKSDGSQTTLVKDIEPGAGDSHPAELTVVGDTLFFRASSILWKTDGTEAGTVAVSPNVSLEGPQGFNALDALGDTLVLFAFGPQGREPWRSDGTSPGTQLLADIHPGSNSSFINDGFWPFTRLDGGVVAGGQWLFRALTPDGWALWASDGTPAGTRQVKRIDQAGSSGLNPLDIQSSIGRPLDLAGTLLFNANDGIVGPALWKSDGTGAGTSLVRDSHASSDSGFGPRFLTRFQESAYCLSDAYGFLWRSDGTESGTVRIFFGTFVEIARAGASLFLVDSGLWRSDGNSFQSVYDVFGSEPRQLTAAGPLLFFSTHGGDGELWASDGNSSFQVADIRPGPLSSAPQEMAAHKDLLFFSADDGAAGREPWASDGTEDGTYRVRDLRPGAGSSNPRSFTSAGPLVFFVADDGVAGAELWKTAAGSAVGSVRVKDIRPGSASASIRELTAFGNRVFFTADDGIHGQELWVSDGSEAGTRMVRDVVPGSGSSYPRYLKSLDYHLLFAATDGTHGLEPWISDGTEAGTAMLHDIAPGAAASSPTGFTVSGPNVYFAATDGAAGFELWAMPRSALRETLSFYTVPPCRVFDTRSGSPVGPVGRTIPVGGRCGIPATARAVAANVTVVMPTAPGHLTLAPWRLPLPTSSTINFSAGQIRANNAILPLGENAALEAFAAIPGGQTHVILDVTGYFQE